MAIEKKKLESFVKRRHPRYDDLLDHWNFLAACYAGGRGWFEDNIFKYLKEGAQEFKDRVARAYRFNHTREIVDLVSKYIFRGKIHRNEENASLAVKKFWSAPTLGSVDMRHFARQMSDKSSTFGRIWVVVDSTYSGTAKTKAEERKEKGRVYAYIVSPQNALNMSVDDLGSLNWILIREEKRDDEDPIEDEGDVYERFRLWTREEWVLYEWTKGDNRKRTIIESDRRKHGLGIVPVINVDHITIDEDQYSSPSLVGDIAYLDRAVANYLSNLDAIIQDQTFSQLAMPAQGILPGDDGYDKMREVGTKRIFLFDGEYGAKPFFLSPDPKQAELIITAIKQIINEIYHTVGMAGERTKQDNAVGIDNSSGVAKAFDFERINALLTSKASILQSAEEKITELVNLWMGEENDSEEPLIVYPESFDIRVLPEEFQIAEKLSLISAPGEVRVAQMKVLIRKLFPEMGRKTRLVLEESLKGWPQEEVSNPSSEKLFSGSDKGGEKNAQDTEQD